MTETALEFEHVTKTYDTSGAEPFRALHDVSFQIPRGRTVAVVGRSGSGKSTLLHLAAAIDLPTSGRVVVGGRDISSLSDGDRSRLRRTDVGLVFQFFHLLPGLSVRDNVVLPGWIAGRPQSELDRRARELLDRVGLGHYGARPVQKLSGGEMQRVAICRSLLARPKVLLADEPTGNLDDENARRVMSLLLELIREEGSTLLFVTHSEEMAALADEIWSIHSGTLQVSAPEPTATLTASPTAMN